MTLNQIDTNYEMEEKLMLLCVHLETTTNG